LQKLFCAKNRIALCPAAKIAYKKPMSQPRRIALLLALATFALYLPVAWFGFVVYDDGLYVTDQPIVQAGVTWAGVKWAFVTMAASNWHPLTWLSHMIDCGVFGLNPAGPHVVNALFHAANVALLFTLLMRITNKLWPSAFIAALFAWHPLHVESVAWIAERKDVLSTFFTLLALLNYARYVELSKVQLAAPEHSGGGSKKSKVYFAWSLVTFALGLMAKPMLVTLPCVLLLLDFWPLKRVAVCKLQVEGSEPRNFQPSTFNLQLLLEKIPFFLISAASCAITFLAQSQRGSDAVVSLETVPLHYRLKSVPLAYVEYLEKTFWPAKLAIFYPLHEKIPAATVALSVALLVLISLATLWLYRTRPYLFTGWFWFLGTLVPVIGLVQVGGAALADRYSYLPSVGIFIAVTFTVCDLAAHFKISKCILAGIAIFILATCVITTENQLQHWRNSVTLFQHALAVTTDNDVARDNLGVALEQQGRLAEAAEQYRAAAKLEPDRYQGHHNLANALDRLGHPAEALAEHREAVRLGTDVQFLHHVLGLALVTAGKDDEALKEFATAAQLDAHYPWPHVEIAKIYLRQNRDPNALDELRTALRIDPDDIEILTFTAQVLAASENPATRNGQDAFALAAKANALANGRQPNVLDVLGMACAELGKFDDAQMAAQTALDTASALELKNVAPIQKRLQLYRNHQPWRETFGATNAPPKN
jgi:tetratricopeptide (TPR) repeat protein